MYWSIYDRYDTILAKTNDTCNALIPNQPTHEFATILLPTQPNSCYTLKQVTGNGLASFKTLMCWYIVVWYAWYRQLTRATPISPTNRCVCRHFVPNSTQPNPTRATQPTLPNPRYPTHATPPCRWQETTLCLTSSDWWIAAKRWALFCCCCAGYKHYGVMFSPKPRGASSSY